MRFPYNLSLPQLQCGIEGFGLPTKRINTELSSISGSHSQTPGRVKCSDENSANLALELSSEVLENLQIASELSLALFSLLFIHLILGVYIYNIYIPPKQDKSYLEGTLADLNIHAYSRPFEVEKIDQKSPELRFNRSLLNLKSSIFRR